MLQLTFNPGFTLTGLRTTRSWLVFYTVFLPLLRFLVVTVIEHLLEEHSCDYHEEGAEPWLRDWVRIPREKPSR